MNTTQGLLVEARNLFEINGAVGVPVGSFPNAGAVCHAMAIDRTITRLDKFDDRYDRTVEEKAYQCLGRALGAHAPMKHKETAFASWRMAVIKQAAELKDKADGLAAFDEAIERAA